MYVLVKDLSCILLIGVVPIAHGSLGSFLGQGSLLCAIQGCAGHLQALPKDISTGAHDLSTRFRHQRGLRRRATAAEDATVSDDMLFQPVGWVSAKTRNRRCSCWECLLNLRGL
ncbi:hypothetical protein F5Y18DRAFT_364482 [Xylariaceae sp. FL1019]|nr:hypothetical protein F5Y18DRAFT_364482 [Xylariaceae sp. FL1019]